MEFTARFGLDLAELLERKGHQVYTINSSRSVFEALQVLAVKNVGALVVVEEKSPVGILSERDYARKVMLSGASSLDTPVKKIMSHRLISATPKMSIETALVLMNDRHIRHLPVLDDGVLAGMVSIGDLVKALLEKKDLLIAELKKGALPPS